jgi:hypothetical protein
MMARPRSWFEPKEFNSAKKAAKSRGQHLWKYARPTRAGKPERGYYVGSTLPTRLDNAATEAKL